MRALPRDPIGELFNEFARVQGEVNRLFHSNFRPSGPPMNLWSDDQNLYAEVDLPGFDPARIDVTVTEGNKLTIHGERTAPEVPGAVWVRQERPVGRFDRELTLPVLVDADRVEADYVDGVLRLTLPKSEAARPRKITVKA
jgi:HSP20 family protein